MRIVSRPGLDFYDYNLISLPGRIWAYYPLLIR